MFVQPGARRTSFNVAASIKMRKSAHIRVRRTTKKELQCGRIYKDAEISWAAADEAAPHQLQCGRIYKDAEIENGRSSRCDACNSFNVAASIKMRKYDECEQSEIEEIEASMWPHL